MLQLVLQVVAGAAFAVAVAAIIELLRNGGQEQDPERMSEGMRPGLIPARARSQDARPNPLQEGETPRTKFDRTTLALLAGWHVLAVACGTYLSYTAEVIRAIFPLCCWLYLGYWVFVRRLHGQGNRRQ